MLGDFDDDLDNAATRVQLEKQANEQAKKYAESLQSEQQPIDALPNGWKEVPPDNKFAVVVWIGISLAFLLGLAYLGFSR